MTPAVVSVTPAHAPITTPVAPVAVSAPVRIYDDYEAPAPTPGTIPAGAVVQSFMVNGAATPTSLSDFAVASLAAK